MRTHSVNTADNDSAEDLAQSLASAMGESGLAKNHSGLSHLASLAYSWTPGLGAGTDEQAVLTALRKIESRKEMYQVEGAFLKLTGRNLIDSLTSELSGDERGEALGLLSAMESREIGFDQREVYAKERAKEEEINQSAENREAVINLVYGATGAVTALVVTGAVLATAPLTLTVAGVMTVGGAILAGTAAGFTTESLVMMAGNKVMGRETTLEDYGQAARTALTTSVGVAIGSVVMAGVGGLAAGKMIGATTARFGGGVITNEAIGVENMAIMEGRLPTRTEALLWGGFGVGTGILRPVVAVGKKIEMSVAMSQETAEELVESVFFDRDGDGLVDGELNPEEVIGSLQGAFTELGGHVGHRAGSAGGMPAHRVEHFDFAGGPIVQGMAGSQVGSQEEIQILQAGGRDIYIVPQGSPILESLKKQHARLGGQWVDPTTINPRMDEALGAAKNPFDPNQANPPLPLKYQIRKMAKGTLLEGHAKFMETMAILATLDDPDLALDLTLGLSEDFAIAKIIPPIFKKLSIEQKKKAFSKLMEITKDENLSLFFPELIHPLVAIYPDLTDEQQRVLRTKLRNWMNDPHNLIADNSVCTLAQLPFLPDSMEQKEAFDYLLKGIEEKKPEAGLFVMVLAKTNQPAEEKNRLFDLLWQLPRGEEKGHDDLDMAKALADFYPDLTSDRKVLAFDWLMKATEEEVKVTESDDELEAMAFAFLRQERERKRFALKAASAESLGKIYSHLQEGDRQQALYRLYILMGNKDDPLVRHKAVEALMEVIPCQRDMIFKIGALMMARRKFFGETDPGVLDALYAGEFLVYAHLNADERRLNPIDQSSVPSSALAKGYALFDSEKQSDLVKILIERARDGSLQVRWGALRAFLSLPPDSPALLTLRGEVQIIGERLKELPLVPVTKNLIKLDLNKIERLSHRAVRAQIEPAKVNEKEINDLLSGVWSSGRMLAIDCLRALGSVVQGSLAPTVADKALAGIEEASNHPLHEIAAESFLVFYPIRLLEIDWSNPNQAEQAITVAREIYDDEADLERLSRSLLKALNHPDKEIKTFQAIDGLTSLLWGESSPPMELSYFRRKLLMEFSKRFFVWRRAEPASEESSYHDKKGLDAKLRKTGLRVEYLSPEILPPLGTPQRSKTLGEMDHVMDNYLIEFLDKVREDAANFFGNQSGYEVFQGEKSVDMEYASFFFSEDVRTAIQAYMEDEASPRQIEELSGRFAFALRRDLVDEILIRAHDLYLNINPRKPTDKDWPPFSVILNLKEKPAPPPGGPPPKKGEKKGKEKGDKNLSTFLK